MKLDRFAKSMAAAARGIIHVFKTEQNFRLQLLAGSAVIIAAFYFQLVSWQIIFLIFLVTMVLTMELLNTALEYFADLLKPRLHHYVYVIKDIMAGAVLVVALGALIIGFIIFLPHFISLVK